MKGALDKQRGYIRTLTEYNFSLFGYLYSVNARGSCRIKGYTGALAEYSVGLLGSFFSVKARGGSRMKSMLSLTPVQSQKKNSITRKLVTLGAGVPVICLGGLVAKNLPIRSTLIQK